MQITESQSQIKMYEQINKGILLMVAPIYDKIYVNGPNNHAT